MGVGAIGLFDLLGSTNGILVLDIGPITVIFNRGLSVHFFMNPNKRFPP